MVPLNKWVMSRKIGYALITLWSISTILNVVVEVTGIFGDIAMFNP
jgi:sodium/potassium/calcium exchanger 6